MKDSPGSMNSPTRRNKNSTPVPVSITLYNLMAAAKTSSEETRKWFRPEYESRLLVPTRLDVFADLEEENEENLLYSCQGQRTMIHPGWDLLDERIEVFGDDNNDLNEELYESMRARIVVVAKNDASRELLNASSETAEPLLANIPLHPKRLRRIPNNVIASERDGSNSMKLGPPLKALPPNAILVKYSDGSTRVPSALYDVLVNQDVLFEQDEMMVEMHGSLSSLDSPKRQPRFDDNVFDALDKAVCTPQRSSPSALLVASESPSLQVPIDDSPPANKLDTPDLERTTSLLDSDKEQQDVLFLPSELEANVASLKQQTFDLECMMQAEEEALEHELETLNEAEGDVKTIKDEIRVAQQDTRDILDEVQNETKKFTQAEFQLEAQRIKLLLELQTIYPIQYTNNKRHTIRGLELPKDLFAGIVGEGEVSAALGYLVHTVVMVAKYLEIPLRYRLVCNSSRSAVQEESTMFPLFQARMVDRAHLDRAMTLLGRNVDCLLMARNIRIQPKSHILVKMKRLYDKIINGG